MRRIILVIFFLLLAFYVAWPLWSLYQINGALQNRDAGLLDRKIDFVTLRAGLAPSVNTEIDKGLAQATGRDAATGAVIDELKNTLKPQILEAVLSTLVTSQTLIELYENRTDLQKFIAQKVATAKGAGGLSLPGGVDIGAAKKALQGFGGGGFGDKLGGLLGGGKNLDNGPGANPAPPPAPTSATDPKPTGSKLPIGLGNIKKFSFSLTSYEIGLAQSAASTQPDVTATMAFTGYDWKLVKLVPRVN